MVSDLSDLTDGFFGADGFDLDGLAVFYLFHLGIPVEHVQHPALVIGQGEGDPVEAGVQALADHGQKLI